VRHKPTEADIREYFWSLVDKNGPLPGPATGVKSKCWLWCGSVTDQGYGRFKAGGKTYMISRFAWQEMGKPDPAALTISTRCSNKLCVRHLNTRTRAEIMASVSRRWASGEASHLARVSSKQVRLIRKLYRKGNVTQSALAERFGMSTSNMKRILARRSWKHI
jgi:antitoxin component HigA of HigAB toxin-antitoxin module